MQKRSSRVNIKMYQESVYKCRQMIEDGNIKEGQSKLAEKLHKRAIKCECKVFILDSW